MIYLFSGTPGSGKSLHQAKEIITFLKRKRPIIANYPINEDIIKKYGGDFHYVFYSELYPSFLISFAKDYWKDKKFHEGRIKLFIDEAQLLFNARNWQQKGRDEWLSFFTQHRKYGYDIYLVSQFDMMIDKQVRSLIEYEVRHRKVSNFGFFGQLISLVFGGSLFVAVEMWYPLKTKITSSFFTGSKKLYSLYNSYSDFATQSNKTD